MTRFTRFAALAMVLVLCFALAACGASSGSSASDKTAEDYANLIRDSRSEDENQYFEIVGGNAGEDPVLVSNPYQLDDEMAAQNIGMMFDAIGVTAGNLDRYAFTMSLMMTQAYHIGIYKPAEGKAADVQAELEAYIKNVQSQFEHYLPDQYDISLDAIVKTAASGEVIVVMAENAAEIADKIEKGL